MHPQGLSVLSGPCTPLWAAHTPLGSAATVARTPEKCRLAKGVGGQRRHCVSKPQPIRAPIAVSTARVSASGAAGPAHMPQVFASCSAARK